ncbi:MAG: hypothetical protein FJZ00_10795, partial [Candidatus Sericytochromatia bacterium]|nr:hypothetical protein [Candidatus Tanganyikabacteria bacterium]
PDVRHFGAAQTIDQRDLFGRFAAESADLPVPSASPAAARRMAAQVADALALARSRRMPVHLNCPFDEPLHPAGAGSLAQLAEIPAVWPAEAFASEFGIQEAARALNQAQRPLIVAGPEAASPLDALAVLDLGRVSGAPIAADVASGLRYRSPRGAAVLAASDAIFGAPGVARLGPDLVISLGLVPTSKALNAYLAHHAPPVVRLQSGLRRRDPDALALRTVDGNIGDACRRLAAAVSGFPREPRWQRAFQAAGAAARASLDDLDRTGGLSLEAAASRAALAAMPPGSVAMFSNSLPVRYGDLVCDAAREGVRILANRGANGIDGITSTALGAAAVSGKPLLLVIGDVAFLHDLGGLYAMRHARAPVVILLLDNDGGGIFSLLPIAGHPEVCEPLCATPHGLAPEHAAALHGTRFHSCRSASDVSKAVESACQARSGHLLVVKTDRQENAAGYRSALAAMRERVQRAAGALFEEVPA